MRDAGVRGQELPFEGGRLTHRRHARIVTIRPSCLEQFGWPLVEQFGVAIGERQGTSHCPTQSTSQEKSSRSVLIQAL